MKKQRLLTRKELKKMFNLRSNYMFYKLTKEDYFPQKILHKSRCLFDMQAIYDFLGIESNEFEEFIDVKELSRITGYSMQRINNNINKYPHYTLRIGHRKKYLFRKKELQGKLANIKYQFPLFYHINDKVMENLGYLLIFMQEELKISNTKISIIKRIFIEGEYNVEKVASTIRKHPITIRRSLKDIIKEMPSHLIDIQAHIKDYRRLKKKHERLQAAIRYDNKKINKYQGRLAIKVEKTKMSGYLKEFLLKKGFETYGDIIRVINKNRGNINTFLDKYHGFGPKRNMELKFYLKRDKLYEYIL